MTTTANGRPGEAPETARLIPLSVSRGSMHGELYAIVDEADYEDLAQFNWYAQKDGRTFYARRNVHRPDGTGTGEQMHRRIIPGVAQVDHINHNGLDNRRANLRSATHAENQRNRPRLANNTSGYIGVRWRGDRGKWQAQIMVDGRYQHLGYYDRADQAAAVRDRAALGLHGEFAQLNFQALPVSGGARDVA